MPKNPCGDYTQGKNGWQIRLYDDSTFYLQDNIYFEVYPQFHGKWSILQREPLTLSIKMLGIDTTSIITRYLTLEGLMSTYQWTLEFVNEDFASIKKNNSIDGPILKRGTLHVFVDESQIYAEAHSR